MLEQTIKAAIAVVIIGVTASFFIDYDLKTQPVLAPAAPVIVSPVKTVSAAQPLTQVNVDAGRSSVRGVEYLTAQNDRHYHADIEINGVTIKTLVDTGASVVAFGAEDAERAGIRPSQSEYKYKSQTANGEVAMARVIIPHMRLGSIELDDVEAAVLPDGALKGTLLGMSFLNKLKQVQTENGRMVLTQ